MSKSLKEELESKSLVSLKEMMKKLKVEESNVRKGSKRCYFISQDLEDSNVEFFRLLNKNFYSTRDKVLSKAKKFRDDDKNIEKYQMNHKKEKMRREAEYMELAFPKIEDDLWEVELEQKLVLKALKSLTSL